MEYVRARTIVITGLVLALVAVLAIVTLREVLRPGPGCTTALGEGAGTVTVEQADNAATIAGVGLAMGMPDHAVTVALATAMQESGLRNLPDGDRDSAGLFQQRPSQGWGTLEQVTDPVYAATAFYAKLRTEPDWPTLSVTEAAQLVQRSATPEAYARWEPMARSLGPRAHRRGPGRDDLPQTHAERARRGRRDGRRRRARHGAALRSAAARAGLGHRHLARGARRPPRSGHRDLRRADVDGRRGRVERARAVGRHAVAAPRVAPVGRRSETGRITPNGRQRRPLMAHGGSIGAVPGRGGPIMVTG